MKTGSNGISLIKQFEGCRLKAYPDPATGGAPWTIGYGHTGNDVRPGMVWTQVQADSALISDLAQCERAVSRLVSVSLTQNQFDALVSFVFNVGSGNLQSSTLNHFHALRQFSTSLIFISEITPVPQRVA